MRRLRWLAARRQLRCRSNNDTPDWRAPTDSNFWHSGPWPLPVLAARRKKVLQQLRGLRRKDARNHIDAVIERGRV